MIISKRRKFLITSLLLSIGFGLLQFLGDTNRIWFIFILGIVGVLLFYWALLDGLSRDMTLLTLVLPFVFTIGVGIFWFLLPSTLYTQIPLIIAYGVCLYVLSLTLNIYTVSASAVRTIALYTAAKSVGFVMTLLCGFLLFDSILSLKLALYFYLPLVFISAFLLIYQGLWSVNLEKEFNREQLMASLVMSFIVTQIAGVLYFWPVTIIAGSLSLTVVVYVLLGLGQAQEEKRLFPSIIREHFIVAILVFISILLTTKWS